MSRDDHKPPEDMLYNIAASLERIADALETIVQAIPALSVPATPPTCACEPNDFARGHLNQHCPIHGKDS